MPDSTRITIAGFEFEVPQPYAEGHTLKENEAGALNQTYAEAIRNNTAARIVKAAVAAEALERDVPEEEVTREMLNMDELQAAISEYAESYEFGQRSGGGRGPTDPVERVALTIAKERVVAALSKKGISKSEVKAAEITRLAKQALAGEVGESIRELARSQVESTKNLTLDALDLDDLDTSE